MLVRHVLFRVAQTYLVPVSRSSPRARSSRCSRRRTRSTFKPLLGHDGQRIWRGVASISLWNVLPEACLTFRNTPSTDVCALSRHGHLPNENTVMHCVASATQNVK